MTTAESTTGAAGPDTAEAGGWQATHVFYAANPRPLLLQCVRPLVRELEREGLLANYFFINYWLEGPHVRLRMLPSSAEVADEVRTRTEQAVDAFLHERPALYEVDTGFLNEFYNALFDIEFPADQRGRYTDADGRMNLQPNNSRTRRPYEPEYGKYGGPAGIELAEWHFRHSSDLVIDALATKNLHLRTVLLGTSAQLMMVISGCFIPEGHRLVTYLESYYDFWHRAFPGTNFIGSKEYDRNYAELAPGLARRFTAIRGAMAAGETGRLPAALAGWADHCAELRERAVTLARNGDLVFRAKDAGDGDGDDGLVTDPEEALRRLLSPYMHMTNNRLHVTIRDEAYLSHVLSRSLREFVLGEPPRAEGAGSVAEWFTGPPAQPDAAGGGAGAGGAGGGGAGGATGAAGAGG